MPTQPFSIALSTRRQEKQIMKLRASLAAIGATAVLGTAGALALPAAASAHSTTHTLKFISVTQKSIKLIVRTGGCPAAASTIQLCPALALLDT
jgi:hypothetical protein